VALDYGRRRIGVAATDPSRMIASPHSTVRNDDPPSEPPKTLLRLLRELEPGIVLVGIPVNMDGSSGGMAAEARVFATKLATLASVPVIERDERLSSFEAEEMLREMDLPRRRKREKGLTDMLAATVLLREFLEEAP